MQIRRIGSGEGAAHEAWARAGTAQAARLRRPRDVPRAESVDEVALWAESEDFRRTELIFAPVFWVGLPLAAIGFLVQQAIAVRRAPGGTSRSSERPWGCGRPGSSRLSGPVPSSGCSSRSACSCCG